MPTHRPPCAWPARRLMAAALGMVVAACSTPPPPPAPPAGASTLQGWRHCSTEACGRDFISAYSTFNFVHLDGQRLAPRPTLPVPAGRHWVEAHYAWGAGVMVGVGNYRHYGFEWDFLPDHRYQVLEAPSGCLTPATRQWVSPKTLRLRITLPNGDTQVQEVPAWEHCTPSASEPGTCRQASDCRGSPCTTVGGHTGFGLCGTLRP